VRRLAGGRTGITTGRPIAFEPYASNRSTGSFILIDPLTNFTAGAGMIAQPLSAEERGASREMAERLARAAREAVSEPAAVEAVRAVLEEALT
jgi:sulfate adenylyltransferase subunit 1 (EFTu-like GTPase family)